MLFGVSQPILAIFHIANVFSVQKYNIQVEHQEAVEEAVQFQDRTGVLLLLLC